MFCRKCGSVILEGHEFCAKCGTKVYNVSLASSTNNPAMGIPVNNVTNNSELPYPKSNKKDKKIVVALVAAAIVLFCTLIGVIVVYGNNPERKLEKQLELAQRYLEDLDYEQAIATYEAALEIDPKCVDAYIGLAEVYEEMEDYEKAAEILQKGLEETDSKAIEKAKSKLEKILFADNEQQVQSEAGESHETSEEQSEEERLEAERLEQERIEAEKAKEYEEFISNTCGDSAIEAYIEYFDKNYGFDSISQGSCYCIYLNNDKIPELVVDGGDAASGAMIFTYGPDGVSEIFLRRGEFLYWEKKNVIDNDSGNSGGYGDAIIEIKNGVFNVIAGGSYFIKDEYYSSPSWDEDYMWNCVWEGEDVTYSEYNRIKESYFPSGDGQWNNAYDIGVSIYGTYAFYDAYHDLMIRWGEAEYWEFYGGMEKPNIYIYPDFSSQQTTVVDGSRVVETNVTLTINNGTLTSSWPESVLQNGKYNWHVYAGEDGTIYDSNGNEYSYLFWEGTSNWEPDFSKGFCVRGDETAAFLRSNLSRMGLTPREYNEFIVYWAPRMQGNKYNLISFQGLEYTNACPLCIKDSEGNAPNSMLRVMMAWKPADSKVTIEAQTFVPFDRTGFTVVEWGGRECN